MYLSCCLCQFHLRRAPKWNMGLKVFWSRPLVLKVRDGGVCHTDSSRHSKNMRLLRFLPQMNWGWWWVDKERLCTRESNLKKTSAHGRAKERICPERISKSHILRTVNFFYICEVGQLSILKALLHYVFFHSRLLFFLRFSPRFSLVFLSFLLKNLTRTQLQRIV